MEGQENKVTNSIELPEQQFNLGKLRIEDCARERESLRGLEWRFFFEANAAYAAIAISFFKIHGEYKRSLLLLLTGIAVTAIVTFAAWRLLRAAHRRLYEVQTLKYRYFDCLHAMTGLKDLRFSDAFFQIQAKNSLADEEFPFYDVRSRLWAIFPQYLVLGTFVICLCGWMYFATWWGE
jgi:hypothetical protein